MKSSISLILFLIIAAVAWWTITEDYSDDNQLQSARSKQFVEIFMNDFELTAMDENGVPGYLITGNRLEKYNDSSDTNIEQPVFHILQKDKEWKINAATAIINNEDEIVTLENNVIMQQQNIEPAVTIRTQKLTIDIKKQLASTRQPVEITQGDSLLKSTGMIFNNITSEMELYSNVSGYYLPL